MLIDANDYICRVNGAPLYYNGLRHHPVYSSPDSPPYTNYDFLMSKLAAHTPLPLTPPVSPLPVAEQQTIRGSVIMKVENCQIVPAGEGNVEQHVCRWENCYRIFESLEKLAKHVSFTHSAAEMPSGLYYCKWEGCQRSERGFNARYKMLVHCRTHTKEKPHCCLHPGCSKAFSRAENLKIHFRSHTLEKPYRCSYPGCIKAYSNSSDRFKHSRTHLSSKPYSCRIPGCLKRYTDPSSLRKHVKTFNHESQNQKTVGESDESMDFETNHEKTVHPHANLYYNAISYSEHLESSWMTQRDHIIAEMENVKLDQPLDLSTRQNR